VLDIVTAVADETPAAAFELTGRAVELGYDLRSVIRELSRVVRDLLVLSVDPSRIDDPEISSETERDRLKALVSRFSREDLLRAFDVLSKAEFEIRSASQPRYHLEMALLRWIHMRKLVPLTELLGGVGASSSAVRRPGLASQDPGPVAVAGEGGRDAFLLEVRKGKAMFYNTVVAQAQKIEFGPERVTFSFLPAHRMLREQVETNKQWLEQIASAVAGKRMMVAAAQAEGAPESVAAVAAPGASHPKRPDLKTTAMADSAVQAMLDVFPGEIENVEEIE